MHGPDLLSLFTDVAAGTTTPVEALVIADEQGCVTNPNAMAVKKKVTRKKSRPTVSPRSEGATGPPAAQQTSTPQ